MKPSTVSETHFQVLQVLVTALVRTKTLVHELHHSGNSLVMIQAEFANYLERFTTVTPTLDTLEKTGVQEATGPASRGKMHQATSQETHLLKMTTAGTRMQQRL